MCTALYFHFPVHCSGLTIRSLFPSALHSGSPLPTSPSTPCDSLPHRHPADPPHRAPILRSMYLHVCVFAFIWLSLVYFFFLIFILLDVWISSSGKFLFMSFFLFFFFVVWYSYWFIGILNIVWIAIFCWFICCKYLLLHACILEKTQIWLILKFHLKSSSIHSSFSSEVTTVAI